MSQLTMQRGVILLHGDFGIPMPVDRLSPSTEGIRLVVENAAGAAKLDVTLPGGQHWVTRRGAWVYRDARGRVGGIRKVAIRDRTRDNLPEVEVALSGRGRSYGMTAGDLPLALTVVLGDAQAAQAGACGHP